MARKRIAFPRVEGRALRQFHAGLPRDVDEREMGLDQPYRRPGKPGQAVR